MTMAYLNAMASKDPRTKIGAIIVGPDNEIRSSGYNGFPRGCDDDVEERYVHPEKYYWFEHAERNAIYNAARIGVSTRGCTLYTQAIPCADCARAIIQSGIKKIVIHKGFEFTSTPKWLESIERSKIMLAECGVEVVEWKGELTKPARWLGGETEIWTGEETD